MMNVQSNIRSSAILAGIIISVQGPLTLSFPIRPPIFCMATDPSGIIFSAPSIRRPPDRKTFTIAKIMVTYCTRVLFNIFPASIAFYRYSFPPDAEPAYALMFPVTSCTAKARFMFSVRFYLKWFLTDFTNNCFHTDIIPRMDD